MAIASESQADRATDCLGLSENGDGKHRNRITWPDQEERPGPSAKPKVTRRRRRITQPSVDSSEEKKQRLTALRNEAYFMREMHTSGSLGILVKATKIGEGGPLSVAGVQAYRDQLVEDAVDAVEEMMLEQLAFAHFQTCRLHSAVARSMDVATVSALATAAARLMAEFRRSALALQAYREKQRVLAGSAGSSSEEKTEPANLED